MKDIRAALDEVEIDCESLSDRNFGSHIIPNSESENIVNVNAVVAVLSLLLLKLMLLLLVQ